ncbi:Predicted DNA-binding protein, contains XRE-type HTH domain [Collimonas sp. OK307]|uniref:helix-turn-helix domain-containing protein n=1 Tax=Collimonas sp. OK307 TaxID=1801620 RepID=UPI0008EA0F86|nr:XRE family transcriptional regulator [Collimonas sp. OK307]SFI37494.1 Predicted DNA-binding protein, contains XRE-type HTH domain [Collimonas sp. OK307]
MNKIDTQVRHITKPGANLFAELGFSEADAKGYQAESRGRIDHTLALKEQLMGELVSWIKDSHLKQGEAAEILHVTRPRVSDVVNKKTSKFTIDALVDMLARVGKPVSVMIG